MQDLYKQAILDAKAVRASAIANAKATLQEAFAPQVEALVKQSLSEDAETEYEMEEGEDHETILGSGAKIGDETGYETTAAHQVDEEIVDETTLEEILAELEGLEEDDSEMPEEEASETIGDEEEFENELEEVYLYEAEEEEEEGEEEEEEGEEEEEEGEEEEEEGEDDGTEGPEADEAEGDDEEIVLTFGQLKAALAPFIGGGESTDAADVDLDEILGEDYMEMEESDKMEQFITLGTHATAAENAKRMQEKKHKEEMEEATAAIEELRSSLNEVNLLNAKLLYMNKIFKAKSLTESHKVKVVNAFDRANNVKEVKNIFATLNESISAPKTQLKESYNAFASKPSGYNPKQNITETDPFISRMQVLAGIK
jgi:hypothetical protein